MKKGILLVLLAFVFGCSDDDSPKKRYLPTMVTTTSDAQFDNVHTTVFTYDEQRRIKTVNHDGDVYTLSYDEDDKLTQISSPDGTVPVSYNDDGQVSAFSIDGINHDVTYLGGNDYILDGDPISFFDNGDIKTRYDADYEYASSKGAFADVRGANLMVLLFLDNLASVYGSKKRLTQVVDAEGDVYPFTSSANENGYPELFETSVLTVEISYSEN